MREAQMAAAFKRGIYPIQYALFDAAGALSRDAMRRQIEICLAMRPAGIATLGLATEVRQLSAAERRRLLEWNIEDIAGRAELAASISEPTPEAALEALRHAATAGAGWAILQPPASVSDPQALLEAFSWVIERSPLPVAIQNAPHYIGVGLEVGAIVELGRRHPNLRAVKQEVPAVETAALIDGLEGRVFVYSGRGGLELVDCLAAGIHGHIPAPEYADRLARVWDLAESGDRPGAWEAYRRVLPLATFIMQGLPSLLTYGKLLLCARHGLPYHQRNRAYRPTRFGVAALAEHCRQAGIVAGFDDVAADLLK
jgi:4-hydroxy-tetrahydrodipicolinate synthase